LLKTGFVRQVKEVKIQMKNPGSALRVEMRLLEWEALEKGKDQKTKWVDRFIVGEYPGPTLVMGMKIFVECLK
jgi:hypothetical protein